MLKLATGILAASASDPWTDTLFGLSPDQRFWLILISIGCLTAIVITIVSVGIALSMRLINGESRPS